MKGLNIWIQQPYLGILKNNLKCAIFTLQSVLEELANYPAVCRIFLFLSVFHGKGFVPLQYL